jgi:hypothetical protein
VAVSGTPDAKAVDAWQSKTPERRVELLWKRLGIDNRVFLSFLAGAYPPGKEFTLSEAADTLNLAKGTIRARLMNIGRSQKSLGPDAPQLWQSTWDEEGDENTYEWNPQEHQAVVRLAST